MLKYTLLLTLLLLSTFGYAQDSISVRIYPKYDSVGKFHRFMFGENYRKEYAMDTKVPIIKISEIKGGLTPTQRGGGNQSHSLRLVDRSGKEWVLRSVEKYPEILLPEVFRKTFAGAAIKDNMSAQNPFAALIVPIVADAVKVPHSDPMIGWVLPDAKLGQFSEMFENTLCLLEEREPVGDTDNSEKMLRKLNENSDNSYDGITLLRAKAMDALLGDWDRHEDQWRWKPEKRGDGITYIPIPRDRDQVFYLTEGIIPRSAQVSWLLPMIQGYDRKLKNINWFFWEGRAIYSRWFSQISEDEWTRTVNAFCDAVTDDVLEKALRKLPEPGYTLRHDHLLKELKARRAALPKMMNTYYHFINRIVDIQATNKNELITISDTAGQQLTVTIRKISKEGNVKDLLFKRTFNPEVTKELRVYVRDGNDSLILNNSTSKIKLRIIGAEGVKKYHIENSNRTVRLYSKEEAVSFTGNTSKLHKILDNDTSNTHFVATDLYKRKMTLLNAGYNIDDKLLLGLSYTITQPGFRNVPIGSTHSFSFLHSFATTGFRFSYKGEFYKAIGNADLILQANAMAPENSQNFFGLGNETTFNKSGDYIRYYRARFSLYQLDPALRWHMDKSTLTAGPSIQYYRYNRSENDGRLINNMMELHSPDSATVARDKTFAGITINYSYNNRNNDILPSSGTYLDVKFSAYKGLNTFSNTIGQLNASYSIYKNLNKKRTIILSDRIGGGVTVGKQAFYQSQFLGGQGNLLGYREFRFGGQHSLYNNLEARVKIADFISYVLPGQFGLIGLYDIGRVWIKNEQSDKWHQGYGGGIYFAPASLTVFRVVVANSEEGTYPYIAMKFRY
ncbi:BamA/TamA family outer membrane protein [Pedobacter metabolipauper]|uniref:Surface antigen-like protein n=1 Tax=Pedobacter metabolipauper TaxID=425513 RepID=A0A4V3D0M0_9SPHI|nr:BamA/TamA family outer membrane protein [Pedobacter metabolipauper]TDQ06350.1 surface antigen-like protein [Pedobacter metabolipauper]